MIQRDLENEGGRKYFFVQEYAHEIFDELVDKASEEDAVVKATAIWDKLSPYDRKRTERAYLIYAFTEEDGSIDYNTGVVVHTFK